MSDLDHLGESVHADMSRVDWPEPGTIRAAGHRRARTHAVTAAVAVLAVIAAIVVLLPRNAATMPAGPAPSGSASAGPSPTGSASAPIVSIPVSALLTTADVAPAFAGTGPPFAGPDMPNPFIGCGPDGIPGSPPAVAAWGVSFHSTGPQMQALLGGESVLRYPAGGGRAAMGAIGALVAGACASDYHVVAGNLGGDESILLASTSAAVVGPQAAHGIALYYAIVRHGDYLIWVAVIDEAHHSGDSGIAGTLGRQAGVRLCAAVQC